MWCGDVDGDRADAHLDAGAVLEVEAAEVDVVAEPLAVLVIDEEPGRGGEHLARLLVRRGVDELARDAHVADAARRGPSDAVDLDLLDRVLLRREALRWRRLRRGRVLRRRVVGARGCLSYEEEREGERCWPHGALRARRMRATRGIGSSGPSDSDAATVSSALASAAEPLGAR